ncbi:hypothetical protein Barb4_04979 [Bacteroidales bacterium Barb4]|nr:hypothetical protein Barb4_04979 [Bacteroidales bacterium Barb4]
MKKPMRHSRSSINQCQQASGHVPKCPTSTPSSGRATLTMFQRSNSRTHAHENATAHGLHGALQPHTPAL